MESFKFEKNTIVSVVNEGKTYTIYSAMANKLGAVKWEHGRSFPSDFGNRYYIVVNFAKHEHSPTNVYLVKDSKTSEEYLISEEGLAQAGKYKIGDKVTVRTWKSMEKQFGKNYDDIDCKGLFFVPEMEKYCGKTYTITGLANAYNPLEYFLSIDSGLIFRFNEHMFVKNKITEKGEDMYSYKVKDTKEAKAVIGMAYGFG
jgi:hypothetical protein